MSEEKAAGKEKTRKEYKPRMGFFKKMFLTLFIIAVLLVIGMVVHYRHLKGVNPDLTITEYLTFFNFQVHMVDGHCFGKAPCEIDSLNHRG